MRIDILLTITIIFYFMVGKKKIECLKKSGSLKSKSVLSLSRGYVFFSLISLCVPLGTVKLKIKIDKYIYKNKKEKKEEEEKEKEEY